MVRAIATALLLVFAAAVGVRAPANAQERPRVAVLNIDYQNTAPEEIESLSRNLTGAHFSPDNYDLVALPLMKKISEEWAMRSMLSERERADRFGEKYGVDLLVTGYLLALTKKGWLISFVVMNSKARYRGRKALLRSEGKFYSYLSENDPRVSEILSDFKAYFKFPDIRARKMSAAKAANLAKLKAAAAKAARWVELFPQPERTRRKGKPRLAILSLELEKIRPRDGRVKKERLPNVFFSSRNFELAGLPVLQQVAEEWAMPSLLSEQEKADRLGERHQVDLLVKGRLMAFTRKGWLVSFVIMNSKSELRTRKQILMHKGEFYSYLSENNSRLAAGLAGLRVFFHIEAGLRRRKDRPPTAIAGTEVKAMLGGKVMQATGNYFVLYREDGRWAVSRKPQGPFDERGNWWIKDDRFCVTVVAVRNPFCRYVKKVEGGFRLVMRGGAEQDFVIGKANPQKAQ